MKNNYLIMESGSYDSFAVIGKTDTLDEFKKKVTLAIKEEFSSEIVTITNFSIMDETQISVEAILTDEDGDTDERVFELIIVCIY
jgi:hypothetical protein